MLWYNQLLVRIAGFLYALEDTAAGHAGCVVQAGAKRAANLWYHAPLLRIDGAGELVGTAEL